MSWLIRPLPLNGALLEGAVRVYTDAFTQPPYNEPTRGNEIRARLNTVHGARPGFRAFCAVLPGHEVIGMTYGYRSAPGQYWHELVRAACTPEQYRDWLSDAYEVVEVAVAPAFQRQGIGRRLLETLLFDCTESTMVLSTRVDSDAPRLYREMGFEVLLEMRFTAGGAPFYVMGKRNGRPEGSGQ
ncbi:hypothetical protein AYO38_10590 [bacterium SCGC AG-212-C10]|nr:hypothetical protein AYO38_10590 [bacterium SCGC AG-212-C10]